VQTGRAGRAFGWPLICRRKAGNKLADRKNIPQEEAKGLPPEQTGWYIPMRILSEMGVASHAYSAIRFVGVRLGCARTC
jgi:hypothetical protein